MGRVIADTDLQPMAAPVGRVVADADLQPIPKLSPEFATADAVEPPIQAGAEPLDVTGDGQGNPDIDAIYRTTHAALLTSSHQPSESEVMARTTAIAKARGIDVPGGYTPPPGITDDGMPWWDRTLKQVANAIGTTVTDAIGSRLGGMASYMAALTQGDRTDEEQAQDEADQAAALGQPMGSVTPADFAAANRLAAHAAGTVAPVPAAQTPGEHLTDAGVGLATMLAKVAAVKSMMPAGWVKLNPVKAEALAWEYLGGTEGKPVGGEGAKGAAFAAINALPGGGAVNNVMKAAAESSTLGAMTAVEGGSKTDVLISMMFPPAMKAVGAFYAGKYQAAKDEAERANVWDEAVRAAHTTLDIPEGTPITEELISQKLREAAKKYHPDINPSPEASQQFQDATAAARTLRQGIRTGQVISDTDIQPPAPAPGTVVPDGDLAAPDTTATKGGSDGEAKTPQEVLALPPAVQGNGSPGVPAETTQLGRPSAKAPGEPSPTVPTAEPDGKESAPSRPAKTPFTRAAIERKLVDFHREMGGGDELRQQAETALQDEGIGLQRAFTFYQKLPGEVRSYVEGRPGAKIRLFRVTQDPAQAGGEDAMAKLGDKYWNLVDDLSAPKIAAAKDFAKKSGDAGMEFWAAVHDNLPPAKERPAQIGVDPASLSVGQEFELNGHKFQVTEDAEGLRLLKDGNDYPETPIDALAGQKIPVDKNTLTAPKEPEVPDDPFAGLPSTTATAEGGTPPQFFDADAAGVSGTKPGLFGQPTFDAATGNKQGGLFHEPTTVETPRQEVVGSKNASDPRHTAEMFGDEDQPAEAKGKYNPATPEPKPVHITGNELGTAATFKELRTRAKEFAAKHLNNTTVRIESDGTNVMIARSGIRAALAHGSGPDKIRAVVAIPELLRTAQKDSEAPDDKGRPTIRRVMYYRAKLVIGGKPFDVNLVIRETNEGVRYYDHEVSEIKTPAGTSGGSTLSGSSPTQPTASVPKDHIGTPPAAVKEKPAEDEDGRITEDRGAARPVMGTATAAKRAPFSGTPAETPQGRKLLRRLQADTAGDKVGPRSINQFLGDLTNSPLLVGKTQTTARNPAHYRRDYHIIRSRSGAWQLDFHEYGHALSAILRDRVKGWVRGLGGDMLAIARMPGSMASAQSVEEGVAEFVRRYIVDPNSLAPATVTRMEDAIRSVSPTLLAGLRDAHRLWVAHAARSIPAQLRSYTTDRPPLASMGERVKDLWASTLFGLNAEAAVDRFNDRLFRIARSRGISLARSLRRQLRDNPADASSALQHTLHVPQDVALALYGSEHGPEGIRVPATGRGFAELPEDTTDALRNAGFDLPDELDTKHGQDIYLTRQSVRSIVNKVGKDHWPEFEVYGQMKAALARFGAKGHAYPGLTEGLTPSVLVPWIRDVERQHPTWKDRFDDINRYMNQLLLVPVLSGELGVPDAIRIKTAYEAYWPLPRQLGDRSSLPAGNAAEPSAAVRRAWGSDLPFEHVLDAIEWRTRRALAAYAHNRLMLAVHRAGLVVSRMKEIPLEVRSEGLQAMLPLRLDLKRVATLADHEQQKIIADYVNEQRAQEAGIDVSQLPPDARVRPEDVEITTPGMPLFRRQRPNAVNIVAPFENGQRSYYQVTDPLLYELFARTDKPAKAVDLATRFLTGALRPWKRMLTQNVVFSVRNLPRDMITAMTLADGWRSLIPGYFHAVGLVNQLRGDPANVRAEGEMLSRALEATFSQAHQSFVDKFKAKLAEGVLLPGWSDMGVLEKAVEIPGQLMSTIVKPIEVALWLTYQPGLSSFTEALPREGAAAITKKQGGSDELARAAADRITGNFGQRSGNPNVAALFRTAGFLNPAVQILYGQYRKLTDPDPAIRAGHWLKLGWLAGIGAVGAAINYLMTSEEDRKRLRERPDAERFREMSIVGRVRIPFDGGLAGSAMSYGWNSVEASLLGDPVDGAKRARALLLRAIDLPGPLDAMHPWIRTALEEKTNYSLFFDRNIVPPWMKEAFPNDPAAQVLPNTPQTYREAGQWMNASPLAIEYAVRSLFTNSMDDAVRLAEGLARGDMKVREPADVPLVGRLLTREPTAWRAQSVQELGQLEAQYQGLRKVEGAMLDRKARLSPKEREDLAALTKQLDGLEKYHEAMLDVRDIFLDIKDLEAGNAPDRQQRIDAKKKEMVDMARKVMGKAALYAEPSKVAIPQKRLGSRSLTTSISH